MCTHGRVLTVGQINKRNNDNRFNGLFGWCVFKVYLVLDAPKTQHFLKKQVDCAVLYTQFIIFIPFA